MPIFWVCDCVAFATVQNWTQMQPQTLTLNVNRPLKSCVSFASVLLVEFTVISLYSTLCYNWLQSIKYHWTHYFTPY